MDLVTASVLGLLGLLGYVALVRHIKELKPKKKASTKKKASVEEKGQVYIIANPSYRSGVFKIGLTTRGVDTRMKSLYATGVPTPFVKCIILETGDCKVLEAALHRDFADKRINTKREWFELDEDDLSQIVEGAEAGGYNVMFNDVEASGMALTGSWPSSLPCHRPSYL